MEDNYSILELSSDATEEDIKKQYKNGPKIPSDKIQITEKQMKKNLSKSIRPIKTWWTPRRQRASLKRAAFFSGIEVSLFNSVL